ncbi:MAG: acyltransferase [Alphaproteobacteria bacterium]
MQEKQDGGKIVFAHMLRGVAILFVLLHHALIFFYSGPGAALDILNMPTAVPRDDWFAHALAAADMALAPLLLNPRNWGAFGVGLFFLVSGFVIPFALARTTRTGFLAGRFFRLWPAYAAGLGLVIAALAVTSHVAQRPFIPNLWAVATHLIFSHDLFLRESYDLVAWTLDIEVRFYLICALAAPLLRRGDAIGVALLGAVLAASALFLGADYIEGWQRHMMVGRSACLIIFMLIGTAFNFHHRGLIPSRTLCGLVAWLAALFASAYLIGPWSRGIEAYLAIYAYAGVTFALCYVLRDRISWHRWLGWLADISYPLYVIHAINVYAAINLLCFSGVPPVLALPLALLWALTAAALIHRLIEKPAHDFGRRLARRL